MRLIRAIENRNILDLVLIIVGDGNLRPDYEAEVNKLDLKDRVCFAG